MICVPEIEALKEPPRKSAQFVIGKQQAMDPGSTLGAPWEHSGSPEREEHESKVHPRHRPGGLDKLLRAELMSSLPDLLDLRQQQDT